MRAIKVAVPAALLMVGFLLCTTSSYGTQDYAKKEKQKCATCHGKIEAKENMPKNLTEVGKCYAANDHSLTKCNVPK
jgi:cytochrome c peroxidase